ncbi:MAG TPA: TonB-dependent receptor [Ohtaekwangia sp.]|nr:TonB-dependent receptor [Ohtaekwangia sp.]
MLKLRKSLSVWITLSILTMYAGSSHGQALTQTVRGKIIDQDSRMPLPGANIVVIDAKEFLGTSTDVDGNFRIEHVPVGRVSLAITFVGYEDRVISNILITTGKEAVLDIEMKESLEMMDAVEINASKDKSEISNEMALTSARGFTVEETKRYAGSFNDPARMVSGYAGVDVDASGDNSIIVRGNSPRGIQWRLEGIDIPNPNHFSDEGATGGPINALNSQMLANSEFFTAAFPAEFGNALSGVFDMKLRKGNNEKREYSLSVGVLGTDVTAEGPFVKGGGSSFLVNYRYSTLSLLNSIGLVDFDGIPKYQDLSFKLHLPTKSLGTFSVFGLGGKSNIFEKEYADDDEEVLAQKGNYKANMGIIGMTQYWSLNSSTYLQNSVSVSQNGSGYLGHKPDGQDSFVRDDDMELEKQSFKISSTFNHKFNASHTAQAGVIFTRHKFDFYNNYFDEETDQYLTDQRMKGEADQYQGFISWKYRPLQDLSLVAGMHAQGVSMNHEISFEPRVSARWQFHPSQAFTAGFGIHGKMESLTNYYSIIEQEDGTTGMPNKKMDFSKARHYVVGYENKLSQNLFFKVEAYYQQLFNIPIENNPNSSYSLINQIDGFTDRTLVNDGTGKNMGLELTLERYFADNYYFLVTTSLFDSKYKAGDGIERNTLFNGNYIGNVLFGKEFKLNSKKGKNKVIGFSTKISSLGARRYTPINVAESAMRDETVYYEDQAFSKKGDVVFIANLAVTYRIDNKKLSQELKLDIQNATNNAAKIGYFYNENTDKVESFDQLPLLPVVSYTIHF